MDIRFYEVGLRQVASGLAKLMHPAPDAIDHLVNQFHTIADIAADRGRGAISKAAQEVRSAAQAMCTAEVGARPRCIDAMASLGQRLLSDLSAQVAKADVDRESDQTRRRALVVDDSRVATTALLNAFQARNFSARAAVTLEEALVELVMFTPEVLVSDVFMPDLDVELLARVFRALTRGRPSLLVLVSSMTGEVLSARIKHIKYDAFVSKVEGAAKVVDTVVSTWGENVAQAACTDAAAVSVG